MRDSDSTVVDRFLTVFYCVFVVFVHIGSCLKVFPGG